MDGAIAILREQTVLCSQLLKSFDELSAALRKNSLDAADIVRKIEPVIVQVNKNSARAQTLLNGVGAKNFGEFLDTQEDGIKRTLAVNLLRQSANLQSQLKNRTEAINRLTANGKAFVAFSMNVMSGATANNYGAAAQTGVRSNRRVFDANV